MLAPLLFHSNIVIGSILMYSGWIGVHLRQARKIGKLGHAGAILMLGAAIVLMFLMPHAGSPFVSVPEIILFLLELAGIAIYGIKTLTTKLLPDEVGNLLLCVIPSVVIFGIGLPYFSMVIGVVLLVKRDREEVGKPAVSSIS